MTEPENGLRMRLWRTLPARLRIGLTAWRNAPRFPEWLQIEPCNRCNLKCVMCPHGHQPPETLPDMTLDTFQRLINEAPGVKMVHLQGLGEPLLNRDTPAMVEYARTKGIITSFTTNMTLMTDDMAGRLVMAGHNEINVSMESADPEILNDIRRGAHFNVADRIFENIAKIRRVKDRLGKNTPRINVYAVLMRHLVPGIPGFVKALKEAGVDSLCFQDLISLEDFSPAQNENNDATPLYEPVTTLPEDQLREIIQGIIALADKDFEIIPPRHLEHIEEPDRPPGAIRTCLDLWERPMITVDGTVRACCYASRVPELVMGNIHQDHFRDIWFGERYENLRIQHLFNRHPSACQGCYQLFRIAGWPRSPLWGAGSDTPRDPTYDSFFLGAQSYSLGKIMLGYLLNFRAKQQDISRLTIAKQSTKKK